MRYFHEATSEVDCSSEEVKWCADFDGGSVEEAGDWTVVLQVWGNYRGCVCCGLKFSRGLGLAFLVFNDGGFRCFSRAISVEL